MEDYSDFLVYLNDSMVKLKELLEKVTILHSDVAIALLETSSLYNPQILIDLTEMAVNGRQFDKYIFEGQEMKTELENLLSMPTKSPDEYKAIMEELGIIKTSLSKNFGVNINNL